MMNRLTDNSEIAKRDFKTNNLIKKIAKANGAIALGFLALVFTGCDTNDKIGTVESTEQTPGATTTGDTTTDTITPGITTTPGATGAALPDSTDNIPPSAGLPNAELVGENVTVSTKVTEVVGPKAFIAYDKESLRGQPILVVSNQDAPPVGTNVEVSGVIGTFDAALIKKDYGLDFTPDVVKLYTNKPYLAAKAIEKVD
ncbi:hypothetical protein [Rivularia sp. UHCC 0363]|uniref:hypothetical protein n=1 Tax=Rivularia sp. UHCC 0363 TaxID=3110244 RepID=UPI002B220D13|nr:hypothetical protein [Rivularia sp. UHCC 0363]MEA5598756.1 hypothetical protein [Rivularia sp. UHCC 0363]